MHLVFSEYYYGTTILRANTGTLPRNIHEDDTDFETELSKQYTFLL